jgi:hypothetical protein
MSDKKNLREKNLEMFERRYPNIHVALKDYSPLSALVIDDDGNTDVSFDNQSFYQMDAKEFAEQQLEEYWKVPTRFAITPPNPSTLDTYAGPRLFNILSRSEKAGIEYQLAFADRTSFTLVVLGVGLGYHINSLVEHTECRAVCFVDVNYEFLYHSLEIYDWVELDEILEEREGLMRFVVDSNPKNLSLFVRQFIRGSNTAGLDGLTFFQHHRNAVLNEARVEVFNGLGLVISSLGFFYDETLMLKNIHKNFHEGNSKYYLRRHDRFPVDAPVFVVGSGPSLDNCLPIIKENADRAFIISAGTSLRPLVLNGIMPDIHLEQENLNVLVTVGQVSKDHDLSSILFMASSTVDPEAIAQFKNVLFYNRKSLSPFSIYFNDDETTLERPHNTVVNAAFSFVQELGFRSFYFFGVDCGATDQSKHHSKDAYQYTEGALHVDQAFSIPVTSNFGGEFFTSTGLSESLDFLEAAVTSNGSGRHYYNCSDGAFIKGVLPLLPKKINLPDVQFDKQEVLQEIFDSMPTFSKEKFEEKWDEETFRECVNGAIDLIADIIDDIEDFNDLSYQTNLNKILIFETTYVESGMARGVITMLRGTFFQIILATDYYRKRIPDKEKLLVFMEIFKDEMHAMLEDMREVALEDVGTLNEQHAA